MFIILSTSLINTSSIVHTSNYTKCVSLTYKKMRFNLLLLICYPSEVKLDRCVGSSNTLNVLSNRLCVPTKAEELNMHFLIWL